MNEAAARDVLLVRAFEAGPASAAWSDADRRWATAEAARVEGERAAPERLLAARGRLAADRLGEREPAVRALRSARGGWLAWLVVLAAGVAGWASDTLAASQRINLLAPPLLALLVWNLAVYAALALNAAGPLRRALSHALQRFATPGTPGIASPAPAAFAADWARAGQPLHLARIAAVLHLAAVALAAGALALLYVRGLAFEYRAGWDSTFLTPATVQQLLAVVLGPAARLTGLPLPGADELAALRFSAGPGENAARWIHLHAVTVAGVVLLPRLLLAALAARRARQLAADFPLPLDDVYFRRLLGVPRGAALSVVVLPYSYQVPPAFEPALGAVLARGQGHPVQLELRAAVPLGGEDEPACWGPVGASPAFALFPLTATPERETHVAFAQRLAAASAAAPRVALIDESGFRQRFGGPDAAQRVEQRRSAWRNALRAIGHEAVFVDLAAPDLALAPWTGG